MLTIPTLNGALMGIDIETYFGQFGSPTCSRLLSKPWEKGRCLLGSVATHRYVEGISCRDLASRRL